MNEEIDQTELIAAIGSMMGWKLIESGYWVNSLGIVMNPLSDMNHAMEVADKCDIFPCITKVPMGWSIFGSDLDRIAVTDDVKEVPLALCQAIKESFE